MAEDKLLLEIVEVDTIKLLHSAAKAGNVEFLIVLNRDHPDLIWKVDHRDRTVHVAVLHREETVFSLIHQIGAIKDLITLIVVDNDGNNILHLAGILGLSYKFQDSANPFLFKLLVAFHQ
ncbi:hypothetical protein A4A49_26189 [Nicotiana attenuata]|uniref:Ankyrin repeat-containing protein n=1 Tax=Nicotiana attenuata TaxID=49451 RepID=A0A1J6J8X7_NICAT|nr:hypothetical protein A4A49_26189 [Nicotiana attenuata]